jgi:hypothetical protein
MPAAHKLFHHAVPSRRYRQLLNTGVALIALVAIIAALLTLAHLKNEAEARAILTTRNLAKSIAQTVSSQLDTIDIALRASTRDIGRQIASGRIDEGAISAVLAEQGARIPAVANFHATDEKGDVLYGPDVTSPINISERGHFIRLRTDASADLVADQPLLGRISQQWEWSFARRISRPDGSFGGVVFASLSIEEIEKMFAQIKLGAQSSIALRDAELRLVARYASTHAAGPATANIASSGRQTGASAGSIARRSGSSLPTAVRWPWSERCRTSPSANAPNRICASPRRLSTEAV